MCPDPIDDLSMELGWIFGPEGVCKDSMIHNTAMPHFEGLARLFCEEVGGENHLNLFIDHVALFRMFRRFARDAYGLRYFYEEIDRLSISPDDRARVKQLARQKLGIRINSEKPRRTRVAAAFSLWLATMRPISFKTDGVEGTDNGDFVQEFCPLFNLWLVQKYLERFGTVQFGRGRDGALRIKHILQDLAYRQLSLSTLELIYCSIFRPNQDDPADAPGDSE
ncbi:MAG: hypothetical protein HQ559_02935 [Lentisphaerae bacterium]|nr:hypothetical protein [Lentisphaerota bacterium]